MKRQTFFRYAIRAVFLFAFVAFLSASVSHVAVFFNNFEADKNNWIGSYMLAISIDLTSLMLTIGIMFFRKEMPWYAQVITITFIIFLTAFSWVVNWEYARTNQGINLETNSLLEMINPILASSFAFLNLAYSFVSEFFNAKLKTADDLQAEADRLEALEEAQKRINAYRDRNRKSSLIQRAKETLIEAKEAVIEVRNGNSETAQEADGEEVAGNFLEGDLDGDLETEEFPEQVAENPRTTIKIVSLTEAPKETDRNTDKLVARNRKPVQSGNDSGNSSETTKRIRGILRRKPYITVSELATKANVSKGYASKVRSQFLKEHMEV
jgi:hypothetical protein